MTGVQTCALPICYTLKDQKNNIYQDVNIISSFRLLWNKIQVIKLSPCNYHINFGNFLGYYQHFLGNQTETMELMKKIRKQHSNLVKRTDALFTGKRLEVSHHHLINDQPRASRSPEGLVGLASRELIRRFHPHMKSMAAESTRFTWLHLNKKFLERIWCNKRNGERNG